MPKLYQRQNIQNLLKNACTVESLTRYCYDLPALKLVYQRLAAETSLLERVDWLMQSAEDDTLDLILNQLQQDQPTLYARYQPYDYPTQVTVPNISRHRSNPFTYGNAISDTARFIGRQREIEQIQSRLLNAEFESSSIVGERRIGKTSLLKYLARPEVTIAAGFAADAYIFVYSDLQMLGPNRKPTDFWRRVLRQTRQFVADSFLQQLINEISAEPVIDTFLLDDLFSEVDNQGLHIVLLLDEFERVTQNTSFDVDFFSGLRAMAIHHNLALITSSRQELIELTHSKAVQDSPFFNIFANVTLRPFTEVEVRNLIETYLVDQSIQFGQEEISLILQLAGPHPYFLQMACYLLYETHAEDENVDMRRYHLELELRQEAAPMFSTYWRYSSAEQQVLLAVMALRMLARGRQTLRGDTLALLKHFYGGAERTILSLEKRGLVLDTEAEPRPYRLFAWILAEWIADELLGRTGDAPIWLAWQREHNDQFGKLTPDMRRRLSGLFPRLNASLTDTLGEWLLNPRTVSQSLNLLENFLRHYKQPVLDQPSVGVDSASGAAIPTDLHMQHLAHELAAYNRVLERYRSRANQHDSEQLPDELQKHISETEAKIAEIKTQLRMLMARSGD